MKKKRKKLNGKGKFLLFGKFLYVITLALAITITLKIVKMDILPMKYLILVIVFLILVLFIIGFFIFKKGVKFFIKVFNILLEIILTLILLFGLSYISKTVSFLNNIKNKLYQVEEYYIVTLKENTLTSINDINGKEVGVYKNSQSNNYENIIVDLLEEHNVLLHEYKLYENAAKGLLNGKIDVLLISGPYKEMVEEDNKDFKDKIKVIDKIEVKVASADISKEVSVSKEPFNIYISGIDTYGEISTVSRSDVNMVVTVNPKTNQILLTSIPRDYFVILYNKSGRISSVKDKLTHAGLYGVETSVATIENILDIDINYYVRVNFTTLKKLVNAIGGIEVNSPQAFTSKVFPDCVYKKGKNELNGRCALGFVRERYAFTEGDVQRVKNQQEAIRAIVKKAVSSKTIVSKYSKILESFGGSFETNMPHDKIYELIKMQLATMPSWEMDAQNLDGYGDYSATYSLGNMKVWVMVPNDETITEAKKKIKKVFEAKDMSEYYKK